MSRLRSRVELATEATPDRLLDAAEELFAARGFDSVSTREIADAAGVNLAGIRYHFGGKRGLYLAVLRRAMDRSGASAAWSLLAEPVSGPSRAAEVLVGFVRTYLQGLFEGEESGAACLAMKEAAEPGGAADMVVEEFVRPHHERLCALVGAINPGLDAGDRSRGAEAIMAMLLHYKMFAPFLSRLSPGLLETRTGIDALAASIAGFLLRGLGHRPSAGGQSR